VEKLAGPKARLEAPGSPAIGTRKA
jgi:hypothetical protein